MTLMLMVIRLITTDLQALSHILAHAYDYPKPDFVKDSMAAIAGYDGLIVVEGEVHKRQRKILVSACFCVLMRGGADNFGRHPRSRLRI
jgi:hypothetical protein